MKHLLQDRRDKRTPPWLDGCCLLKMTRQPSALRHDTQLCFRLFPFISASGCLSSVFFWPAALFVRGGGSNGRGGGQKDRLTTSSTATRSRAFAAIRIAAGVITLPPRRRPGRCDHACRFCSDPCILSCLCSRATLANPFEPHHYQELSHNLTSITVLDYLAPEALCRHPKLSSSAYVCAVRQ